MLPTLMLLPLPLAGNRRLAEGTISPDDYRERRAILEGEQPPPEG